VLVVGTRSRSRRYPEDGRISRGGLNCPKQDVGEGEVWSQGEMFSLAAPKVEWGIVCSQGRGARQLAGGGRASRPSGVRWCKWSPYLAPLYFLRQAKRTRICAEGLVYQSPGSCPYPRPCYPATLLPSWEAPWEKGCTAAAECDCLNEDGWIYPCRALPEPATTIIHNATVGDESLRWLKEIIMYVAVRDTSTALKRLFGKRVRYM
jgi:hypothetical protein